MEQQKEPAVVTNRLPDYFAVLDFEANCSGRNKSDHEIIEFPVMFLNTRTLKVDFTFRHFVKPTRLPILSDFIRELTGITQRMVDISVPFPEIMERFVEFTKRHGLFVNGNTVFVTSGDWDLKTMLPSQCRECGIVVPKMFSSWVNLKKVFAEKVYRPKGKNPLGLQGMIHASGMEFEGHAHSGIVDCTNIVRVLCKMLEDKKITCEADLSAGLYAGTHTELQIVSHDDTL